MDRHMTDDTSPVEAASPADAFELKVFDHVGIRVTDRDRAVAFYRKLGFEVDAAEDAPDFKAVGLVNRSGARVHLMYECHGPYDGGGNVLMDQPKKWPGYTHAAFTIDSMDDMVAWLKRNDIPITEGPELLGEGRRLTAFFRDPDRNVVEVNQILKD
jgi:catechol 2,3-dioxygenase-like lactoylglutathione lyase family enzyme